MNKLLIKIYALLFLLSASAPLSFAQTGSITYLNKLTNKNSSHYIYTDELALNETSDTVSLRYSHYLFVKSSIEQGNVHMDNENYMKAFNLYLQGLIISEEYGFEDMTAALYEKIATIYTRYGDYVSANSYFDKAYNMSVKRADSTLSMRILKLYIGSLCLAGDSDKASELYGQFIFHCKHAPQNPELEYYKYFHKAHILYCKDSIDTAISYFIKSAECALENNLGPSRICASYGGLIDNYIYCNQIDSALHYLKLQEKYLLDNNVYYILPNTYKMMSELYEKIHDHENSIKYKLLYVESTDSIRYRDYSQMKSTHFQYETEQDKNRINILSADSEKKGQLIVVQKRRTITAYGISIVFLAMLIAIYIQKRKLQTTYRSLFKMNEELLKTEMSNRNSQKEYEEQLDAMNEKYRKLRKELHKTINREEEKEETETCEEAKEHNDYATKMTPDYRKRLINGISQIMDNPDEFCNPDFNLARLAKLLDSNTKYVSVIINETYHKNFRTFLNEHRIKEAQIRLGDENWKNYTIKAISESVGYKSHNNFILAFRNMTGITPSMYQKLAKDHLENS